jgi:hypothetical protein
MINLFLKTKALENGLQLTSPTRIQSIILAEKVKKVFCFKIPQQSEQAVIHSGSAVEPKPLLSKIPTFY